MENGLVDYYGENITDGIERYFALFEGDEERVEFNEFASVENMKVYASAKYADDPTRILPAIDYRDPIKIDLDLKVKRNIDWFHVKLQITDKDLKIVGIYDSFQFQEAIRNDKDLHNLEITIPNSIFIDGEYSITVFIQQRDPVNAKWNLLGVYRYWRKFNMKASTGLGYVPAVVYLPGTMTAVV